MSDRPIVYEPHPVSPERKAELRAQGYTIIDLAYKPKDEPALQEDAAPQQPEVVPQSQEASATAEPAKRRGRPPKSAA